ncbi:hypothetical protein [Rhodococcus sp. BS-15]|uniref:hypothetical protein n=1 Tax=Rhodococcus sp. BS-15 TaxID=1304954 RepID=UPI000B16DD15|nr:hypothetical protein [Rhodococcus sp. BS-15]
MQITIEIEDTYANGDEFAPRTETVTVNPPPPGVDDLEDWATDELFPFTGRGDAIYANIDGMHEVKVVDCTDRTELVGQTFSFG